MANRGRVMADIPTEREMRRMIEELWQGPRGDDPSLLDGYGTDDSAGDRPFGTGPGEIGEGRVPFPWARPKNYENMYQHGIFWNFKAEAHPEHLIERPDVDEVRRRAEPMIKRIWKNYAFLDEVVQRHEPLIQRRWEKKSKLKRREVILAAWGTGQPMPKERRPDLRHIRNRKSNTAAARQGYPNKHLFLWPNLTQEDLVKKEPLLLLLNARARNPPSLFAHADLDSAHLGIQVAELPYPPVLKKWNMRFLGRSTPETYGELISWDADHEAKTRLSRFRDVSPGEGLFILEIQDRLYRFLADACRTIIQDLDLSPSALRALPQTTAPPVPSANPRDGDSNTDNAAVQSLRTLRYESMYHVPSKFNVTRLRDVFAAKYAEVADTIWALREDPGFFIQTLHEWYEHRAEMLVDEHGKRHPCHETTTDHDAFVGRLVGGMLDHYLPQLELWAAALSKLDSLDEVKTRLFDNSSPPIGVEDDLPDDLVVAFCSLLSILDKKVVNDLEMVLLRAMWSPPMRYLFQRELPTISKRELMRQTLSGKGSVSIVESGAKKKTGERGIESDYLFALEAISEVGKRRVCGLGTLVDELDRIVQQPEARTIVTSRMQEQISDIVIVSEGIRECQAFRPWADTFERKEATDPTLYRRVEEEADEAFKPVKDMRFSPKSSTCLIGGALFRMKYPIEKNRSKGNVEAMQAAERQLDLFWDEVIDQMRKDGAMKGHVAEVLTRGNPERTADWLEPLKKKPPKAETGSAANVVPAPAFIDSQSSTKVEVQQPKNKSKTRGIAEPVASATTPAVQTPALSPAVDRPTFTVDRRAYKVFTTLFHQPSVTSTPGEISWPDFLRAMSQIGFRCEKLGGSAWQFAPGAALTRGSDAASYARGIQFHEPHPVAKIRFHMARLYGRRLARAYGWCRESFRVAE